MPPITVAQRRAMPDDHFALAKGPDGKPMFPLYQNGILSKRHIRLAWDMVDRAKGLSDAQRQQARDRILQAAKQVHIDTSDWQKPVTDNVVFAPMVVLDSGGTTEDGHVKPMRVRLKGTRVNVVNNNNALYPTDVVQDALQRFNQSIATGRAVGESPHPRVVRGANNQPVFDTSTSNTVWRHVGEAFMDSDGWVYTDVEIIPTAKGKDVQAMIEAGIPVGDSMRALANWTERTIGGKTVRVPTRLDIFAFDCVMNEATAGSQVVAIINDSLQPITDSQMTQMWEQEPPGLPREEVTLMPAGFAVLNWGEALTDNIQFTEQPIDPSTGEQLTPQDPDGDGDIDFYTNQAGDVFMTDRSISHESHARTTLRPLPPYDDGDNYGLARQWQKTHQKPATDSSATGGTENMPTIQEILASAEFQQAVQEAAQSVAKPALDAAAQQETERQRVALIEEARTHIQQRLDSMEKLTPQAKKALLDSIQPRLQTKEQGDVLLDSAIEIISVNGAQSALQGLGFNGAVGDVTRARIEVGNEPKPWQPVVDSLLKGFDEYGTAMGHEVDPKLRKYNQPFIDKILAKFERDNGYQALRDSAAFLDSAGAGPIADSVSITTAQLLNQPTILEAVIVQAFQDVESLQFLMVDTFEGTEWRIPVETYSDNLSFNAATGILDIMVPEGGAIPESNTNLGWLSFSPSWRRNAFSMSEDAMRGLLTGPAKYPAVARAIYHLGYAKRRRLDDAAYYEMILASDEFNPSVVASETAVSGNMKAVSNGSNATYSYQLQAAAGVTFPVTKPRTKPEIQGNGQITTVTTNPFTVTAASTTQVLGYLDANGNITNAGQVNGATAGTNTATYAVDWENGIIYFNAASGFSTTALPTFTYSASTNYDTWHYTIPTGDTPDQYYNTLLQQITRSAALMGSSPRYKKPNLAIMSLNVGAYIENAAMWYKLQSPEGSEFTPDTENFFGKRAGVNFARINAPWGPGDGRMLFTQRGATRYGIQTPYVMEGPFQKIDQATANFIDAKGWIGKENSVLCTPQVVNTVGQIINPVSRTLRIVP